MLIKTFRLTLKPSSVTWTLYLVTRVLKFKITLRERCARDNKNIDVWDGDAVIPSVRIFQRNPSFKENYEHKNEKYEYWAHF